MTITLIERRHGASQLNRSVLLESALLPWRLALRSWAEDGTAGQQASDPGTLSW